MPYNFLRYINLLELVGSAVEAVPDVAKVLTGFPEVPVD
jgi:hypothetical protein